MLGMFGTGLIGGLVGLVYLVFWLWMLFHAITNNGLSKNEKILWVLVVFFLPCIGSILYFFLVKSKTS